VNYNAYRELQDDLATMRKGKVASFRVVNAQIVREVS
jgi:hypothetical protein